MSFSANLAITSAVTRLYQAFPYPAYPLWARLRWQEGYLGASLFASHLRAEVGLGVSDTPLGCDQREILVAGSGEVAPYILRCWEPFDRHLTLVDVARRSLNRARWRLFRPWFPPSRFLCVDLEAGLNRDATLYGHADAFGVLHHIAAPDRAISALGQRVAPGGTLRVMVYNHWARSWIHHLSRAFQLLELDPYLLQDRHAARALLQHLAADAPPIGAKLRAMGPAMLANDARLVDTFFHPREVRLPLTKWMAWFREAGFTPLGLFDRYGELDHWQNPLWHMPDAAALDRQAQSGHFAGNWEFWLAKEGSQSSGPANVKQAWLRRRLRLLSPPLGWFSFAETETIQMPLRQRLWSCYVNHLTHCGPSQLGHLTRLVTFRALQRLVRLGAVLPLQIEDAALRSALAQPLAGGSEPHFWDHSAKLGGSATEQWVRERMATLPRADRGTVESCVMARLERAQTAT